MTRTGAVTSKWLIRFRDGSQAGTTAKSPLAALCKVLPSFRWQYVLRGMRGRPTYTTVYAGKQGWAEVSEVEG